MSPGLSSCHHRKRTRAELSRPLPLHVKCDSTICSTLFMPLSNGLGAAQHTALSHVALGSCTSLKCCCRLSKISRSSIFIYNQHLQVATTFRHDTWRQGYRSVVHDAAICLLAEAPRSCRRRCRCSRFKLCDRHRRSIFQMPSPAAPGDLAGSMSTSDLPPFSTAKHAAALTCMMQQASKLRLRQR